MFTSFKKFLVVGVINTGSTYLIYLFFNLFVAYSIAYTIAYLSGIAISYYLNARWTFASDISLHSAIMYPSVHVAQYFVGILSLHWLIVSLQMDEKVAPLIVVLLTLPVTFLLSKWILTARKRLDS